MRMPEEVNNKVIELASNLSKNKSAEIFRSLSDRYMDEKNGKSLLTSYEEAIVYAMTRMPSTYAAVNKALSMFMDTISDEERESLKINSLIDVGAGTGAATIAALSFFDINDICLIEREENMMKVGRELLNEALNEKKPNNEVSQDELNMDKLGVNDKNNNGQPAGNVEWIKKNFKEIENNSVKSADMVISSYMLNELNGKDLLNAVQKLFNLTNNVLLIVEPGTPKDHRNIIKMKDYLSSIGANIVAPCTIERGCNLPDDDWCHFKVRVERTKLQKGAKNGELAYEDEKFTYLVASKKLSSRATSRLIRHPIINKNTIDAKFCENGEIKEVTYTKGDKEIFNMLKKADVGEIIDKN